VTTSKVLYLLPKSSLTKPHSRTAVSSSSLVPLPKTNVLQITSQLTLC